MDTLDILEVATRATVEFLVIVGFQATLEFPDIADTLGYLGYLVIRDILVLADIQESQAIQVTVELQATQATVGYQAIRATAEYPDTQATVELVDILVIVE